MEESFSADHRERLPERFPQIYKGEAIRDMTLRTKLSIGFGSIVLVLLLMAATAYIVSCGGGCCASAAMEPATSKPDIAARVKALISPPSSRET